MGTCFSDQDKVDEYALTESLTLRQQRYDAFMEKHKSNIPYGGDGCAWKSSGLYVGTTNRELSDRLKISIVPVKGKTGEVIMRRFCGPMTVQKDNYGRHTFLDYELLNVYKNPERKEVTKLITFVLHEFVPAKKGYRREDVGKRRKWRYAYMHLDGDTYEPICGEFAGDTETQLIRVRKMVNGRLMQPKPIHDIPTQEHVDLQQEFDDVDEKGGEAVHVHVSTERGFAVVTSAGLFNTRSEALSEEREKKLLAEAMFVEVSETDPTESAPEPELPADAPKGKAADPDMKVPEKPVLSRLRSVGRNNRPPPPPPRRRAPKPPPKPSTMRPKTRTTPPPPPPKAKKPTQGLLSEVTVTSGGC